MAGIFKAYDIRGIVGETLTEETAEKIGRAFVTFLGCKKVVLGRDMRGHSQSMFDGLARGIMCQGADVIDLGLVTTPMSYYGNGKLGADASIIITASHNPAEWNGFKLCREQAIPISGATGIQDIEKIVADESFAEASAEPGNMTTYDIIPEYVAHIRTFADIQRPIKIAIDFANAMGIYEARVFDGLLEFDALYDELDDAFPNHEANPLKHDTLEALQQKVREGRYDFGVAFDGDADRAGFLDEKGDIIPMDMITALIAQPMLKKFPGSPIFYDLRSSWAVREVIEESGGKPMMSRVGHAFIKQQMRDADAVFAGELSGHYYFRDNYFTESSAMAVLLVASMVSQFEKPLSAMIEPIRRYVASGEINSKVADSQGVFARLRETFTGDRIIELDGLSVEFDDWWFNVRASNTEPLIRLNLEARTEEMMTEKRDQVLAVIRA